MGTTRSQSQGSRVRPRRALAAKLDQFLKRISNRCGAQGSQISMYLLTSHNKTWRIFSNPTEAQCGKRSRRSNVPQ